MALAAFAEWGPGDVERASPATRMAFGAFCEAEAGPGCTQWRFVDVEDAEWCDVT
jgi:hypothetical protein